MSFSSGWTVNEIKHLRVNIAEYEVYSGASYIELPIDLLNKKCLINPKNENDN